LAWIELHQSRQRHPKTLRLAAALGISRREACGLLDDLWTWALDAAQIDGLLLGMSATDIAVALDYPHKQGAKLLDAMTLSGYMDVTDGGEYALHDWYDYAGKLNDRRQRDAEYQRKKRTTIVRQSTDVGTTSERHRAVPYPTVPNRTIPNRTISEGGNGAASPRPSPARFTPPSLDEVRAYCKERGSRVDPEKWHDFYASKGWMVGKNKMRDWKAAVRTWEKEDAIRPRTATDPNSRPYIPDDDGDFGIDKNF
jgi:hypothetical protein